jgi:hypothetical protein
MRYVGCYEYLYLKEAITQFEACSKAKLYLSICCLSPNEHIAFLNKNGVEQKMYNKTNSAYKSYSR